MMYQLVLNLNIISFEIFTQLDIYCTLSNYDQRTQQVVCTKSHLKSLNDNL